MSDLALRHEEGALGMQYHKHIPCKSMYAAIQTFSLLCLLISSGSCGLTVWVCLPAVLLRRLYVCASSVSSLRVGKLQSWFSLLVLEACALTLPRRARGTDVVLFGSQTLQTAVPEAKGIACI